MIQLCKMCFDEAQRLKINQRLIVEFNSMIDKIRYLHSLAPKYGTDHIGTAGLYGFRIKEIKTVTESEMFRKLFLQQNCSFALYKDWVSDHATIEAERKRGEYCNAIIDSDWMAQSRIEVIPMPSNRKFELNHTYLVGIDPCSSDIEPTVFTLYQMPGDEAKRNSGELVAEYYSSHDNLTKHIQDNFQ